MSKSKVASVPALTEPDAEQVASYLREHPDFLAERPALLEALNVPHPQHGNALSLIERQVKVMRERNTTLQQQLSELVGVARDNQDRLQQLHDLQLELLDASDLNDLLTTLETRLRDHFACDAVRVILTESLLSDSERGDGQLREVARLFDGPSSLPPAFKDFVASNKPLCGRLRPLQLAWLFGDAATDLHSAAVTPLGQGCETGLIALASTQDDRFNPAQGTVFLNQLSGYCERLILRHTQGK